MRLYIISFINYTLILSGFNKRNILFELSEITLKTNGIGIIKIFSDNFFKDYNQCDIYINNILQNETKNEYNFSYQKDEINIVKITWNITLKTAMNMFFGCDKIIEIDLSKFESSNIISMAKMFFGCSSLISLNLSGFNLSKVNRMDEMFYNCSKLISLDLSFFNISEIIDFSKMFYGCRNLEFIKFKFIKEKAHSSGAFSLTNKTLVVCIENEDNILNNILNEKNMYIVIIIIIIIIKINVIQMNQHLIINLYAIYVERIMLLEIMLRIIVTILILIALENQKDIT